MKTNRRAKGEKRSVQVVVDDRERRFAVVKELEAMDGVDVEIRRIPLADYCISNELLMERKTVVDFARSVANGRLFRQAYSLAISNFRTCFVLEGDFSVIHRCGLPLKAFQGAVVTLSLVFNLPCLWSRSPEETSQFILLAGRQLSRRRTSRPRFLPRKRGSRKRIQSQMLEAIPGVGPQKANAILAEFGTMRTLVDASVEELLRVQGIGPQMAQRIAWTFGEPQPGPCSARKARS